MGAWGTGIYSDDEAMDLRGSIAAMSKLPLDGREILRFLREESQSADDPTDTFHTGFWLVTAHQFAKRGIDCPEAMERALEIIRTGRDLDMKKELGLAPAGLRAQEETR